MKPQEPGRLLLSAAGVIEAPLDAVAELALEPEARDGAVLTGGPTRFGIVPAGHAEPVSFIEVDRERRSIAMEGRWWFRGVYSLESHPAGTLVVYRVYDVARRARWLVPMILLQYRLSGTLDRRALESELESFIGRIGRRLGRATRLVAGAGEAKP